MSIEIKQQIIEVAKELTNLYGDDYGEQYSKIANNVLQLSTDTNNQYILLIEASYALIDSDYKDKIILYLQKKVKEQDAKIKEQDTKIKEQNVKIKEQDAKIKEQDIKIDNLTKKLNNAEQNQLYKKF